MLCAPDLTHVPYSLPRRPAMPAVDEKGAAEEGAEEGNACRTCLAAYMALTPHLPSSLY
jgi:hypothetical protein